MRRAAWLVFLLSVSPAFAQQTGQTFPQLVQAMGVKDSAGLLNALTLNANGGLNINCVAGCSGGGGGGTSSVDEAAFTFGTTSLTLGGGVFQTTATNNALTTGQGGAFQVTANRALFVNPRNAAGTEIGTSGAPIRIDPTGTTTQPVSGTVTANAGTNLNTSALALDTSVNGLLLGQASTTSGQKGPIVQGAVTTSAPSYTTAQTDPLSLNTAGGLRVDGSGVTQPVSAASLPLPAGASTSANQPSNAAVGSTSSGQTGTVSMGFVTTAAPSYTTAQTDPLSLNTSGGLRVDPSGVTSPVSGTVTANAGTGNFGTNLVQVAGSAVTTSATGQQKVGIVGNAGAALDAAGQNVAPPANELLTGCTFFTSPTTITSGNMSPIMCDSVGNHLVDINKIGNATYTLGQNTMANSAPVAIASNQSAVPINYQQMAGSNVVADPCKVNTPSYKNISITADTQIITGTASKQTYICAINLFVSAADNVAVVEGTGTTCATSPLGVLGGATAATGYNFAANQGIVIGNGDSWIGVTATLADNVCILRSSAAQISGSIKWVQQ